jgi:hypothetical protein
MKYPAIIIVSKPLLKILTFGFAKAIAIFPFIILRYRHQKRNVITMNHESIHIMQQLEFIVPSVFISLVLFIVFGYSWWYMIILFLYPLVYWFLSLVMGYAKNPMELEAYGRSNITGYWLIRKPYEWIHFF